MNVKAPQRVLARPTGSIEVTVLEDAAVVWVREDVFGLRKYPPHCPIELRLGSWEMDGTLAVVLLVRLARLDATTFESWIDASMPEGVRILQCLASQSFVDVHFVTDSVARSLRATNEVRIAASARINVLRSRNTWTPEEFEKALLRVSKLYPTAKALWWACEDQGKP
jgi:hypothetical protein